ncbi:MAG: DNA-directed RNA polymerase subunit omega [Candidatus Brocadiales bacterium]
MKEYYKLLDSMSKKAGGPYRLSSILLKRVRQLVRGSLRAFRPETFDPVSIAFDEYSKDQLQIVEESSLLELIQTKEKKKKG